MKTLLFFLFAAYAVALTKSTDFLVQNPLNLHHAQRNGQSAILTSSKTFVGSQKQREIPGGSPLRFCEESRDTDLFAVDYIELVPYPLYM